MKITMKRLASLAMTGALALSMSVPAFAAANETVITSSYTQTTIDVVVTPTANAFINPYGLGTTLTKSDSTKVKLLGQIVTEPMTLKNKSDLELNVNATVTGAIKDGSLMKLAIATTKAQGTEGSADYVPAATTKSAYVKFQVAPTTVTGTDNDTLSDSVLTAFANETSWNGAKELLVGTRAVSSTEPMVTLEPSTMGSDGAFSAFASGSVAMYRLTGDCAEDPTTAWTTDDGFKTTVAFTFKPVSTT